MKHTFMMWNKYKENVSCNRKLAICSNKTIAGGCLFYLFLFLHKGSVQSLAHAGHTDKIPKCGHVSLLLSLCARQLYKIHHNDCGYTVNLRSGSLPRQVKSVK